MSRLLVVLVGMLIAVEPAMSDSIPSSAFAQRVLTGELVKDAKTAIAITEILIKGNYGEIALSEQMPLIARDDGSIWVIEGSLNKDRSAEGPGTVIVKINKSDAKVISLLFDYVIHPLQNPPRQ